MVAEANAAGASSPLHSLSGEVKTILESLQTDLKGKQTMEAQLSSVTQLKR